MAADFEVTIYANLDPANGLVAEGAAGGPAVEADYAHVRNWLRGLLLNLEGALPAGWELRVDTLADTATQRQYDGDPRHPVLTIVAPDRLAQIEVRPCATCGGTLRRDTPDGIWWHVVECADPTPVTETGLG